MAMTQTLSALSTPSTLLIKNRDQHRQQEQKVPSFAEISESMKPSVRPSGGETSAPSLPVSMTGLHGQTNTSAQLQLQSEKFEHSYESKSALQQLQAYMELSPAEQIRFNMLNEMNLTEEELANLPPEEQQAIEQKIAQRIKDVLGADATFIADKAGAASPINLATDTNQQGMDHAVRLYQAISQTK